MKVSARIPKTITCH